MRTLIVVTWGCLILAGAAGAATYVVDQAAGDDAATGTEAAPWKTVGRGVGALKAGDTLVIREGVYRESAAVKALGTAEAPITIRAAEGQRVVLSGADRITEWTRCTMELATGNEQFQAIYYTDIDWTPTALFEDGKEQPLARTPNEGWWPTVAADHTTVTDPVHLTQQSDVWTGATLFFFRYKGVTQTQKPIKSFDAATHTLTLAEPLATGSRVTYTPGSDRYRIENKVTLIDRPGEWAFERKGEGKTRVYYRPHRSDVAESLIEIPRRERILVLGSTAYCTVEGLEIAHAVYPGRTADAAIGCDANKHVEGAGRSITIKGCSIHHNGRFGYQGRGYTDFRLTRCLVFRNQYGVSLGGHKNALIEANEVAENLVDGIIIGGGSEDVAVRRNFIHHHNLFGHPDNIQLHTDVRNITFEDNLILSAGQSVMMEACDRVTFRNNIVAGSAANMMIMGHGNATNGLWVRNTFALWASSLFSLTAQDYELRDNIMVNNGGKIFYSIPAKGKFESDHNLWYVAPGVGSRLGGMRNTEGKTVWFNSLDGIREKAGQEKTSEMKDPEFANAPVTCTTLDNRRIGNCTRERLCVNSASLFQAGDVVEVHFDGVVRKVTAVDGDSITVSPPLAETPDRVLFVANWKEKTDFTLDFSSPHNDQYGSTVDAKGYAKGDFDGDGKRDVPAYR